MTDKNTVHVVTEIVKTRRLKMAYNRSQSNVEEKIPAIRFSGQYLAGLGFKCDGSFDLTINPDRSLTLKAVDEQEEKTVTLFDEEGKVNGSQDQANKS